MDHVALVYTNKFPLVSVQSFLFNKTQTAVSTDYLDKLGRKVWNFLVQKWKMLQNACHVQTEILPIAIIHQHLLSASFTIPSLKLTAKSLSLWFCSDTILFL